MDYTTRMLSMYDRHDPAHAILVDAEQPSRCVTWTEYTSLMKKVAVGLQSLGVAEQDGVGILSYNDIYYYVFGDGVIAAGAVYTGIPTFAKQVELATAIKAAGLQWLVVSPEFLDLALVTVQSLGMPSSVVIVFDPPGREAYVGPQASFSKIIAEADEAQFRNANEGKDTDKQQAFRLFTSGSTGSIKAAVISHRVQMARIDILSAHPFAKGSQPRSLHHIGMYHVSGLQIHTSAILGNSTVYISRSNDAATLMDQIASFQISVTMITPHMMESLAVAKESVEEVKLKLASLKVVAFTGAPCRQVLVDEFRKIAPSTAELRTAYGSTEVIGISWQVVGPYWKTGQVGHVISATELRIIDPETLEDVQPGGAGEICLRSVGSFTGYYGNEAATKESFLPNAPDWFRTGDKGCLDPQTRQLSIVGRYKQIFKVRYEEVSPAEVEGELLQHADIEDALVTSTEARDDDNDRECMAYVVTKGGARFQAQDVVDFVASRLAAHKAPTGGVIFCDKIPRGAMGKPLSKEMSKVMPLEGSAKFLTVGGL